MEIFEQYFNKQLDYSYYKYTTEKYIDKLGVDSVVLNKESMPYYIYEILEEEPDDYLYLPVYQKDMERHRFLDSEADYCFYFKKHLATLYSFEPAVVRQRAKELWQDEKSKYKGLPLAQLSNGSFNVALPIKEFNLNIHKLEPAVVHLLKNYGKSLTKS
tara:strand:+ start:5151 stop:5627 length:477 start_codon:yes stop_codon:yes gene_type:complete